ncbi:MAG: LuxR C-terminal-related transcriptional regulator [bacterium]|nr:LuxR C-terminal-related transcriptional regulator [bacterium]
MNDPIITQFYLRLTARKQEILTLLCNGWSNEEIAHALFIAPSVVAGHLTEIYGEFHNLELYAQRQISRHIMISVFAPFFDRHPELRASIRAG